MIGRVSILLLLLLSGCTTGPVPEAAVVASPPDEYPCARVPPGSIRVDGEAGEWDWRHASWMTDFRTAGTAPAPARVSTAARLLHDSTTLYAFFTCRVERFTVAEGERDAELWNGEAAELFLCPGPAATPYFEFDVNPHGTLYDSRIGDWRYEVLSKRWREWAGDYNPPITAATVVQKNGNGDVISWQAELAIPFWVLGVKEPPPPGSTWRFNVFRSAGLASGGLEYSGWQPTGGDFHRPLTFPRLRFE